MKIKLSLSSYKPRLEIHLNPKLKLELKSLESKEAYLTQFKKLAQLFPFSLALPQPAFPSKWGSKIFSTFACGS